MDIQSCKISATKDKSASRSGLAAGCQARIISHFTNQGIGCAIRAKLGAAHPPCSGFNADALHSALCAPADFGCQPSRRTCPSQPFFPALSKACVR